MATPDPTIKPRQTPEPPVPVTTLTFSSTYTSEHGSDIAISFSRAIHRNGTGELSVEAKCVHCGWLTHVPLNEDHVKALLAVFGLRAGNL